MITTKHQKEIWRYRNRVIEAFYRDREDGLTSIVAEFETIGECGAYEASLGPGKLEELTRTKFLVGLDYVCFTPPQWAVQGKPKELVDFYLKRDLENKPVAFKREPPKGDNHKWTARECLMHAVQFVSDSPAETIRVVVCISQEMEDGTTIPHYFTAQCSTLQSHGMLAIAQVLLLEDDK